MRYILEKQIPIFATDDEYWRWHSQLPKDKKTTLCYRVAKTEIEDATVSTVFLGMSAGYDKHTPLTFETCVMGGDCNGWLRRYATMSEAMKGHIKICCQLGKENVQV